MWHRHGILSTFLQLFEVFVEVGGCPGDTGGGPVELIDRPLARGAFTRLGGGGSVRHKQADYV